MIQKTSDHYLGDDQHTPSIPTSAPGIIYAINLRYVAQRLRYSTSTETPMRHSPFPIETYKESIPCQPVVTTKNNLVMPLPC